MDSEPVNRVRSVAPEENDISRYPAHHIRRDFIIEYKPPYMMHNVQQFYDEEIDLRVEMSGHLIPILKDQRNNGRVFF